VTIQDLGSIGEFVAAIATLVTLVYLAFQVRQNTQIARAQLTKDLFLTSKSCRRHDNWPGRCRCRSPSRVPQLLLSPLRTSFNLSRQGLLEESIADSYEKVIRLFARTEPFIAWWKQAREEEYHGEFAAHIDAVLEELHGAA
jgi:hypothetical protein